MKRKAGLFLLAVMVAVSLGAIIVTSLAMWRLTTQRHAEEIRKVEASLSSRFKVFEEMLGDQHERITAHMNEVLPLIDADFEAMGRDPSQLTNAEMTALVKRYDVHHIYFINRSHVVFQTNFPADMNIAFPKGPFTQFLDSVFGAGKVMSDGIDISQETGQLKTYSYFGPKGKDFIIETSTDIRNSLDASGYGWMARYFFDDLLSDPVRSNPSIKDLDIYLINQAGTWSLIHPGEKLDRDANRPAQTLRADLGQEDGDADADRHADQHGEEGGEQRAVDCHLRFRLRDAGDQECETRGSHRRGDNYREQPEGFRPPAHPKYQVPGA